MTSYSHGTREHYVLCQEFPNSAQGLPKCPLTLTRCASYVVCHSKIIVSIPPFNYDNIEKHTHMKKMSPAGFVGGFHRKQELSYFLPPLACVTESSALEQVIRRVFRGRSLDHVPMGMTSSTGLAWIRVPRQTLLARMHTVGKMCEENI